MRKPKIIHPILFASYPILFLFANNVKTLWLSDLYSLLIFVIVLTVLFLGILNLNIRNIYKASLIVSLLMMVILSYMHLFDFLKTTSIGGITKGKHTPVMITVLAIVAILSYLVIKKKTSPFFAVSFANVISLILVVIPLFRIVFFNTSYSFASHVTGNQQSYLWKPVNLPSEKLPDIYYLIFDRYASSNTLRNTYHFDNAGFLNYLEKKGFYIASDSWANYTTTQLSLASSLNMEYLDGLVEKLGEEAEDVKPLFTMMEDYQVWRFLKSQGYLFIHTGSWWAPTAINRYADKNIKIPSLSEFAEAVYSKSIFYPITSRLKIPLLNNRFNQWKRVVYQFDQLAEIPDLKAPTFTFGHFLITHEPFIFDQNGNYLSEEEINGKDAKQNYKEQMMYANKKIEELVEAILSKSKNPPIIIIQSDEGPYSEDYRKDDDNYDWSKANEVDSRYKRKNGDPERLLFA